MGTGEKPVLLLFPLNEEFDNSKTIKKNLASLW